MCRVDRNVNESQSKKVLTKIVAGSQGGSAGIGRSHSPSLAGFISALGAGTWSKQYSQVHCSDMGIHRHTYLQLYWTCYHALQMCAIQ